MGMQSAASLQLLPNSVIIYLHSSVSLSVEYWLPPLTNLIQLINHHHSSAWHTSQSSPSSSLLISLYDLTNLIIVTLTHLIQLIINLSQKSHFTNLISLVQLTVTNSGLMMLPIPLTKSLLLSMLFSQLASITTNRYWRNTS